MPIRLRLAMHGVRHNKFFHLVAIDSRKRRDAQPTELLGVYRPRTSPAYPDKSVQWSVDRIKHWLSNGAQPSRSVVRLLTLVRRRLDVRRTRTRALTVTQQGQVIPPDSQWHPKSNPGSPPPAGPPLPSQPSP
jgi:small subunit ribosomal protein S16